MKSGTARWFFAVAALLLTLAAPACGCGDGSSAARDGGADAPPEGGIVCSSPQVVLATATATHRPLIAYDVSPEGPAQPLHGNGGVAAFLDTAGVAYFGADHFVRLDLDGHLVRSVPYPLAPTGNGSLQPASPVRYPGGYAALLGQTGDPQIRLCLMTQDAWPDAESCTAPTKSGFPLAWDGTSFQLFSYGSVTTYDATGAWVADRLFPQLTVNEWPREAWYLGDNVIFDWFGFDSEQCHTELLWVMPGSLDADAVAKYEPDPVDFKARSFRGVGADTFAAFLAFGPCFYKPDWAPTECQEVASPWAASFLTVIGLDGKPQLLRQPVPVYDADQLTWDGQNLVAIRTQGSQLAIVVWVFDLQGTIVGVAHLGQSDLGFSYDAKYPSIALLVAVAPNDYIMVYNTAQGDTFVTRFQLVPL